MTAYELVLATFRALGVYGASETPTAAEVEDTLEVLNALLDSWSVDRLAVNDYDEFNFPLVVGRRVYTIGEGDSADATEIGTATATNTSFTISTAISFDIPRQVELNCTGDESSNVFIITGTNEKGESKVELVPGANTGKAWSEFLFKTVSAISMTALANTVTAGTADLLDTPRPNKVMWVNLKTSTTEKPLEVVGRERYRENAPNKATSETPTELYYNRGSLSGSLHFNRTPDAADVCLLDLWQPFKLYTVAIMNNELVLPNEYRRALKFNLAVEIAPDYGRQVPGWLANRADESRDFIRTLHSISVGNERRSTPIAVASKQPASNRG